MDIKGLKETLGLSPSQEEKLNLMKLRYAVMVSNVLGRGGNLHGANGAATRKRRIKNKLARKQRKINNERMK